MAPSLCKIQYQSHKLIEIRPVFRNRPPSNRRSSVISQPISPNQRAADREHSGLHRQCIHWLLWRAGSSPRRIYREKHVLYHYSFSWAARKLNFVSFLIWGGVKMCAKFQPSSYRRSTLIDGSKSRKFPFKFSVAPDRYWLIVIGRYFDVEM